MRMVLLGIKATILKELLLLWRDRAGMMVLFFMPAVLVVIISLVQENALKIMGEASVRMLLVDQDGRQLGQTMKEKLIDSGAVEVVKEWNGKQILKEDALAAILKGDYQFGVIIPKGYARAVHNRARQLVSHSLDKEKKNNEKKVEIPELVIYFDPAVRGAFRTSMLNALNQIALGLEIQEKMDIFSELLPNKIERTMREVMEPFGAEELIGDAIDIQFGWSGERLLEVEESLTTKSFFKKTPSSVQHNVPAWALFGMFFIVVPMAGTLIKEKQGGTLSRLMTMPVSYLTLIIGKIIAFVLVCLSQFVIILIIGRYFLPLLGSPMLEMGSEPGAILIITLCAALAATGYGILLGTVSGSFEQASMFGPISIVIAAAMGGIMVPVYAMPSMMQKLSVLSPLNWGHGAFLDIFVREGDMTAILPEALSLFLLFVVMVMVSWGWLFREIRKG